MGNRDMAKHLGVCVQYVRDAAYKLGLYRMRLEYWTPVQVRFLTKHYHKCGDKKLAEIFQNKWPKNKKWTSKHIDKKRGYLGLKRTPAEVLAIRQNTSMCGVYVLGPKKIWMRRGEVPEKSVVVWATDSQYPSVWIKVNGRFQSYYRYLWRHAGKYIPKGKIVTRKEGIIEVKSVKDLECITRSDLTIRNGKKAFGMMSDNWIASIMSFKDPELRSFLKDNPALIDVKRQQIILKRKISQLQ